jgi:hypothetical protein
MLVLATGLALIPTRPTAEAFVCRDFVDAPIAASGGHVYATWATNKTGNWEIMFRASNDSGKTFGDKINLSNSPNANSFLSNVAASSNNAYVSFHKAKTDNVVTYVRTSNDGGKTFGPLIQINGAGNTPQKPEVKGDPKFVNDALENTWIVASGKDVYVVSWDKRAGNWEVFLSASNDSGKSFGKTINLSNSSDAKSDRAWLTTEGNNICVMVGNG